MAKNELIYGDNYPDFYKPFKGVPSNTTLKNCVLTEKTSHGVTPSVSFSSTGVNFSICFGKSVEKKLVYEFK